MLAIFNFNKKLFFSLCQTLTSTTVSCILQFVSITGLHSWSWSSEERRGRWVTLIRWVIRRSNAKRAKVMKSEPKAEPLMSSTMRTTCALAPYFARELPSTQCVEATNHLLCCWSSASTHCTLHIYLYRVHICMSFVHNIERCIAYQYFLFSYPLFHVHFFFKKFNKIYKNIRLNWLIFYHYYYSLTDELCLLFGVTTKFYGILISCLNLNYTKRNWC